MVRRVTAKVDVDAAGARAGAQDTEQSAGRIAGAFEGLKGKAGSARDALSGFGDKIGGLAKDKLGPFGDAAEKAGLDLEKMGPAGLVAGAALAGLGATILGGIDKFRQLAAEVKTFQSAAGLGTEEASRLNAVFKQFGIEAEDGADVLKTMGEIVGTDADKFKTYGVEIAKAANGNVDMTATLGNVAQRFDEMRDPAERAALGSELFGDSWVKIAPILQGGRANLEQLLASVDDSAIVTEEGARQADEYQRTLSKLSEQWNKAQIEIGREALPEIIEGLKNLTTAMNAVNDVADKVGGLGRIKDVLDTLTSPIEQTRRAWDHLADVWRRTTDDGDEVTTVVRDSATSLAELAVAAIPAGQAAEDVARAEDELARAAQLAKAGQEEAKQASDDLRKSYEAQKAAADALQGATLTIAGAALSAESAERNLEQSVADVDAKHKALSDTLAVSTEDSAAAKKATEEYDSALLSAKQAADQHAQAQVALAEQTANASGQTFTAEQASLVYRDALAKVRDQSNDPDLVAGLDGLIGLVDANAQAAWRAQAAADAAAAALARLEAASSGALQTDSSGRVLGSADANAERIAGARAGGGPVNAGSRYLVGERGPEILELGASGYVTPLDRLEQQAASAGQPLVVQLVVDGRTLTEQTIPYHELDRRSRQ